MIQFKLGISKITPILIKVELGKEKIESGKKYSKIS